MQVSKKDHYGPLVLELYIFINWKFYVDINWVFYIHFVLLKSFCKSGNRRSIFSVIWNRLLLNINCLINIIHFWINIIHFWFIYNFILAWLLGEYIGKASVLTLALVSASWSHFGVQVGFYIITEGTGFNFTYVFYNYDYHMWWEQVP
jgi:hypothetical protein